MPKCYLCNEEGNTKEHVPPKSFFPRGYRENLITVPSCKTHNNDNSLDVEYVRNIITLPYQANEVAFNHSQGAVRRSMIHRPQLARTTLAGARPVLLNGEETGMFNIDLKRLKAVMSAMASALYFHLFEKRYERCWNCFSTSLYSPDIQNGKMPDGLLQFRRMIVAQEYRELPMPQPKVFRCVMSGDNDHNLIFHFQFYEGFDVFVFTAPCEGL